MRHERTSPYRGRSITTAPQTSIRDGSISHKPVSRLPRSSALTTEFARQDLAKTSSAATEPDRVRVIREGGDRLVSAAEVDTDAEYRAETRRLRQTLRMLCEGSLKGVFDGATSTPIDLNAPAVSIDISDSFSPMKCSVQLLAHRARIISAGLVVAVVAAAVKLIVADCCCPNARAAPNRKTTANCIGANILYELFMGSPLVL